MRISAFSVFLIRYTMSAIGDFMLAVWFTQFTMMPFRDQYDEPVYGARDEA